MIIFEKFDTNSIFFFENHNMLFLHFDFPTPYSISALRAPRPHAGSTVASLLTSSGKPSTWFPLGDPVQSGDCVESKSTLTRPVFSGLMRPSSGLILDFPGLMLEFVKK